MADTYTDHRSGEVVRLPTEKGAKKHEKWGEKAGLMPVIHHLLPLNRLSQDREAIRGRSFAIDQDV